MVLELGHRKVDQKYQEVFKCGVGDGWMKISWTTVWEMKKYYKESWKKGTSKVQYKEGKLNGLVTSCEGDAF